MNSQQSKPTTLSSSQLEKLEDAIRQLLEVIQDIRLISEDTSSEKYSSALADLTKSSARSSSREVEARPKANEFHDTFYREVQKLEKELEKGNFTAIENGAKRLSGDAALCGERQIADSARKVAATAEKSDRTITRAALNALILKLSRGEIGDSIASGNKVDTEDSTDELPVSSLKPSGIVNIPPDIIKEFLESLSDSRRQFCAWLNDKKWGEIQKLANQLSGDAALLGYKDCRVLLTELEQGALEMNESAVSNCLNGILNLIEIRSIIPE